MTSAQVCILISIAVYLIAMLAIGIVCSKRNNTVDDFYLGGRRLGPVVTAMSAEASDMSSWLLMGLPGVAYLTGVADPGWTAIGLGVGTYINWLVVARRLRRYSARIGAITVPDFFSRRFGEKKHILTAMAAILIIVFFVPYTASGFAACGKLFGTLFGMDYHVAMIISAIVIVGYTATGGFTAASTTDLVQSIVMSIALVVELVFLRKWCTRFCPMAGLMNLVSRFGKTWRPVIDESKCLETVNGAPCSKCAIACEADINLRHPDFGERTLADCTRCRACVDACPAKAVSMPLLVKKGAGPQASTVVLADIDEKTAE